MKYFLILMAAILLASCSVQNNHRRSQSRKYNQCWCIDPWVGAGEWCCEGAPPKYMAPYRHRQGFVKAKF